MSRTRVAWITLGLVTMAAGCRMCASPYDDCSPTFTGQCGEDCAPFARAGSILSGYFPPVLSDGYSPDQLPDLPEGEEIGFGIAFSATDTNVEEALPEQAPVIEQHELPSDEALTVEESKPPQSQGWVAVKRPKTRLE